jgi:hypothetical protein
LDFSLEIKGDKYMQTDVYKLILETCRKGMEDINETYANHDATKALASAVTTLSVIVGIVLGASKSD